MKKTLSIVLCVLLVLLAVACSPETKQHEHDYKLVKEKSYDATCTNIGLEYWECECGAHEFMWTAPDANAHVWKYAEDDSETEGKNKKATCVEKGLAVYVCSECNKEDDRELPIDSKNHAGISNAVTLLAATCAADGKQTVDCSSCGMKSVEQTLAKKTDGHYVPSEDKKSATKIDGSNKTTYIKNWNVKNAATAFVEGSETGVCPTCGKETDLKQDIDCKGSLVVGTYVYSTKENESDKDYDTYYVTVKSESGIYSVEAYMVALANTGAVTTTELTAEVTKGSEFVACNTLNNLTNFDAMEGRAFKFQIGSDNYYLSEATAAESTGKYAVGDYIFGIDYDVATPDLDATKIEKLGNHTAHSFKAMTGAGAVYGEGHYIECSCGLKFVAKTHGDDCPDCGYKSTDWYKVEIKDASSAEIETYYLPKTTGIKVSAATAASPVTYTAFNGKTFKYKEATITANTSAGNALSPDTDGYYKVGSNTSIYVKLTASA